MRAAALQDLRSGRPTEIAFLNLAIAEVGASLDPGLALPQVTLLGRLIAAKDTYRSAPTAEERSAS